MSRTTLLNLVLGAVAATLVITLIVLETSDDAAPPTTTTTTTTSTTTTTLAPTTTTTTTTLPPTTTTTTTTTTTEPPPPTEPPIEPFFVAVVVVNGTTEGELLPPAVERVQTLGYSDVRGLNGAAKVPTTLIFALDDEFRAEAEALARSLGFDPVSDPVDVIEPNDVAIRLFDDAPQVSGLANAKVMIYLGRSGLPDSPPPSEDEPVEGPDDGDGQDGESGEGGG